MRFFIAIEIPSKNVEQLKVLQNYVKQTIPNCMLTDNDKLHLTLAFIGNQRDDLEKPLIEILNGVVAGISPFTVTPAYVDAFPNIHHPHVLWVGVKGDVDKLFILRERIKDGLKQLGFIIDERRYTPHIAIAKTSQVILTNTQEERLQSIGQIPLDSITVTGVKLFQSIPNHGFHSHNTLAEIALST